MEMNPKELPGPILKWPGGKTWLAPDLVDALGSIEGRYVEPFLGGAAVFFRLSPSSAILGDTNPDLMNLYAVVRDDPVRLASRLSGMRYGKRNFYRIRKGRPDGRIARAARLLYLSKCCWNGLYRTNREGQFNTPFGRFDHVTLVPESRFIPESKALTKASLLNVDFEQILDRCREGDVVYLDPPYTVAHGDNGFLRYNEDLFSWEDQERLAVAVRDLDKSGIRFIMSNANHASVRTLYHGFAQRRIARRSLIAGDAGARRRVFELIITNRQES